MDRINNFIDCLLNQRGITKDDREELRIELLDHLTLLKQEYTGKGYNEDEAINLALKNFGDTNEIGNNIKKTLPSRNKYKYFSKIEIFKTILFMLLGYLTTIFYIVSFEEMSYESLLFNILIAAVPIIIGFCYVNLKLTAKIKRVKNIAISLGLFLLSERLIMLSIYLINHLFYMGNSTMIMNSILNFKYITSYFALGIIAIAITNALSEKVVSKIRNPYNANIISSLFLVSSIFLMIIYYLFPNRWYLLHCFVENILGSEITYVSKNILFLIINHRIFIPNVGLVIFIVMGVILFRQINKKGIESLI